MITISTLASLKNKDAICKYIDVNCDSDEARFMRELDTGLNQLLRTDLTTAANYVSASQNIIPFLHRKFEPRFISMTARLALWSGNYRLSLRLYEKAHVLFLKFRDYDAAARLRKGCIEVHMYSGQYQNALDSGRKALRYFRRLGMSTDEAQTLTNIGNVYHRMDHNRQALRYYDKARTLFEKDGGIPVAIVDYNRANIYSNLNQLSLARKLYSNSANIYREAGMNIAETQANYSIAYLLFIEDRYAEALTQFEHVYDKFQTLGDKRSAAVTILDMAEVNLRINQFGMVLMLGDSCLPMLNTLKMSYEEGKAHYFVALANMELHDFEAAVNRLDRATKIFTRETNSMWVGIVDIARAQLYLRQSKYDKTVDSAEAAIELLRQSHDQRRLIDAQLIMLETYYKSERIDQAHKLGRQLQRKELAGYQRYHLHRIRADYQFQNYKFKKAAKDYKLAINTVEHMLTSLHQDEVRYFFAIDKLHSYSQLVECLLKQGQVKESFLQNLAALDMLNRQTVSEQTLRSQVPPELIARIDKLRSRLAQFHQFPHSGERMMTSASEYRSIEKQLWQTQRKTRTYLSRNPVLHSRQASPDWTAMDTDRSLIVYRVDADNPGAWVADQDSVEYVPLTYDPDELNSLIRKLNFVFEKAVSRRHESIQTTEVAEHYLGRIHQLLVEPILDRVRNKKLTIVPSGNLVQIPFAALCNSSGKYLKNSYEISITLNPSQPKTARTSRPLSELSSSVFAVGSYELPLIEREGRRIHRKFKNCRLYTKQRATAKTLAKELTVSEGFVHVAAHASRSSENPMFSRILMSDGPYFPFDLIAGGVNAQLVTLSGCQTAAPGLYYGNSFSLARAFYQAGSRQVLATLWPVADEVTERFMTLFYTRLKRENSVSTAYRSTLDQVHRVCVNPALWGAFILIGED